MIIEAPAAEEDLERSVGEQRVLRSGAGTRRSPLGALQGVVLLSVPFDVPPFLRFSHGSSLECE